MARNAGVKIQFLRDMNPTRVRQEMFIEDAFVEDVSKFGILYPVLTTSSYEIIDGARRLEAATFAGLNEVPVIATNDLKTIIDRMTDAVTGPFWSQKTWLENIELIRNVLGPIVRSERANRGYETKKGKKKRAPVGETGKRLAASLGLTYRNYTALSALGNRLENVEPHKRNQFLEIIAAGEKGGQQPGTITGKIDRDPFFTVHAAPPPPAASVAEQVRIVTSSTEAVRTLIGTMRQVLRTINPDMTPEQAEELASAIKKSEFGNYNMRARLKQFAENKRNGVNS